MASWRSKKPLARALRVTLGVAVVAGVAYWAYARFVYNPVIFGLRDDFVHAVPNQSVPVGIDSLSAAACGTCHTAIYAEWKTSIHAHAWVDPYFQAYWKHDHHIWICLNCHTPVENQQPERVLDLVRGKVQNPIKAPNPMFDAALREEGITCAGCHVRGGVIYGPFDDAKAPHPTAYDPTYRTTQLCYRCHQVPSGPFQFYNGGPCATFFEFEDGPYAKKGYICQTCHMPAVHRPIAEGGPARDGRSHMWHGGHSPEMLHKALEVTLTGPKGGWKAGNPVAFTVHLNNAGAGHKVPTGDPDRYLWTTFVERDEHGDVVRKTGHKISRWIIWKPVIVEVYGNRIPPLQETTYTFAVTAKPGHTLEVQVSYHILTSGQKQRLIREYGLPPDTVDSFPLYDRTVDLGTGTLAPDAAVLAPAAEPVDDLADSGRCGEHPA
jgi:hypothetical protein